LGVLPLELCHRDRLKGHPSSTFWVKSSHPWSSRMPKPLVSHHPRPILQVLLFVFSSPTL
jgi:hypothetical protein